MGSLHPSVVEATSCPPPEIWRLIFSWATSSATSYAVDYEPFQPPRELEETSRYLEQEALRLQTCLALIRVCKLWRSLAEEFLYEDVRVVNAHALQSLVNGMQRSAAEDGSEGYGRYIRRLELPIKPTNFKNETNSLPFRLPSPAYGPVSVCLGDVFRYCRHLEILVRPCLRLDADDVTFWGGLISSPLVGSHPMCPHLKRLEWSESDLDLRFYGTTNSKRLAEIISHSPNLRYLFISSDRPDVLTQLPLGQSLRTLRLNRSHYHSRHVKEVKVKDVPNVTNLTNLVLHTTIPSPMLSFITAVVTYSSNQMQRILSRCPNLEELVYHLGAPEISPLKAFQHAALKRVRLRLNPEEWFPHKHVVLTQFGILAGPSFPGLENVILHDSSKSFVRRDSSSPLLMRMRCPVVYEDGGSVVPLPKQAASCA
ncbi:hypothetical protein DFH09DRAFT_1130750 [Mycena vulgaris]|nr:hypothetical protein DFH09DRAFT_1130750 [Mycena vulgaris]